jgi:hypothetical protein
VAARLLALSQTYGLASREMSLVAVVTRPGDRPHELPETRVVPVGMAQDTDFEPHLQSSFSGGTFPRMGIASVRIPKSAPSGAMDFAQFADSSSPDAPLSQRDTAPSLRRRFSLFSFKDAAADHRNAVPPVPAAEDILLDLASRMESDGGMPGENRESRVSATIVALLAFLSQGHTHTSGAFRSHVARLESFLQSLTGLSGHVQQVVAAVMEFARKDTAPAGDWIALARTSGNHLKELERRLNALG